ncbi:MAG: hypothetical protein LAO08_20140 [Acidobacteriia bacterium]|nr:hypothetical protein [Terriglobia bacterium]
MAVKPATGETLVEERRTRIESPAAPKENTTERLLPIWDFVESMDPGYFSRCEFTIYRGRSAQKAEEKTWIGKFYEKISPDIIQKRWGGGEYNVWMKVPVGDTDKLQLKYNVDLKIEGPQKAFSEQPASNTGASNSEIGQVLAMMREDRQMFMAAIERLSGSGSAQSAVQQALALNGQVFSAAMPAVVKTLEGVGGGGHGSNNPMDELTRTFLQAAITKMLNPADPIENFAKMAQAMGGLGFKMGGANPTGGLAVELARGLMGALPQLAAHVGGIMDQYRRAEEAKMQTVAMMRGSPAPITVHPNSSPVAPTPQPGTSNVIEMPASAEPAAGATPMSPEQQMNAEQVFQYVETKVVELLLNLDLTPEEAANDALTFIDVTDKHLVDELLRHGEAGLRWAFTNREILKRVPSGPRLETFISEFVKNGRKVAVPVPLAPDPNIPPA